MLPGFTAEAALYWTCNHYHLDGTPTALVGKGEVSPQLRPGIGFCMASCRRNDFLCLFDCLGGSDTPELPPPSCLPSCSPCLPDPDSPTGFSRTCVNRLCEDSTTPCGFLSGIRI